MLRSNFSKKVASNSDMFGVYVLLFSRIVQLVLLLDVVFCLVMSASSKAKAKDM